MEMLERITGHRRPRRLPPGLMMGVARVSTFVLTRFAPDRPLRFTPDAVRLLQMHRRADITKARTELGFAPTSIERAVRDAYDWFVARGRIRRPSPAMRLPAAVSANATAPVDKESP
jgi:dihydroflavonol-4-reductase